MIFWVCLNLRSQLVWTSLRFFFCVSIVNNLRDMSRPGLQLCSFFGLRPLGWSWLLHWSLGGHDSHWDVNAADLSSEAAELLNSKVPCMALLLHEAAKRSVTDSTSSHIHVHSCSFLWHIKIFVPSQTWKSIAVYTFQIVQERSETTIRKRKYNH